MIAIQGPLHSLAFRSSILRQAKAILGDSDLVLVCV